MLASCGVLGEGDPEIRACLANPILYVNDDASNDSLNLAMVKGFQFSLVPNASHTLVLQGKQFSGSKLYLERVLWDGTESVENPIIGVEQDNDEVHFSFESTSDTAELHWGVIRNSQNGPIFKPPIDINFLAAGDYDHSSLGINYHFLGVLTSLDNDTIKTDFQDSVHSEMHAYLSDSLGISLLKSGPYIVDMPAPVTVDLVQGFQDKDSLKEGSEGYIDVVFVENLTPEGLLGFAQRNGFSSNDASIIVIELNSTSTEVSEVILHELGHFLGLRHTVPTARDILGERDLSNLDDGFEDTPNCEDLRTSNPNYKLPSLDTISVNSGCAYWRAQNPLSSECALNLMFPENDPEATQLELSKSQADLIKKNLTLYPH